MEQPILEELTAVFYSLGLILVLTPGTKSLFMVLFRTFTTAVYSSCNNNRSYRSQLRSGQNTNPLLFSDYTTYYNHVIFPRSTIDCYLPLSYFFCKIMKPCTSNLKSRVLMCILMAVMAVMALSKYGCEPLQSFALCQIHFKRFAF